MTYKTGEEAPKSGVYGFVEHTGSGISCSPTAEEKEIPLSKGEKFPPCKSCHEGAIWKFKRKA